MRFPFRIFLSAVCLWLSACAMQNSSNPNKPSEPITQFKNDDWAFVLSKVVSPDGYVQWDLIQNNTDGVRDHLLSFVGLIAVASPNNHPELFANESDRRAYRINAYNALCMYGVVRRGYPASFASALIDSYEVGGIDLTAPVISDQLSAEDPDPRICFALNFCAHSSPPLRAVPYDGAILDAQLADQGHVYLRDPRAAVRQGQTVLLNDWILDHKEAFIASIPNGQANPDAALISALRFMATGDSPVAWATQIGKLGFDGRLNRPPR